jgi:hypothetical protein
MPRDLTDLMERATSFAPPEPHAAHDITRLAAQRHRRRTSGMAAGLAAAVLVAVAAGYGVTRGHDTTPLPAARYKYDQTVSLADAVPARSLPGYTLEPWTIPSVQRFGPRSNPAATYQDVDADGRLIVWQFSDGEPQRVLRVRLFDGPGEPAQPLRVPPSPGSDSGHRISWIPSFLDDDHLLWTSDYPIPRTSQQGFHITDLSGGDDVFVHSGFTVARTSFDGSPRVGQAGGVSGERMWFQVYDHSLPDLSGTAFDLYNATFDGKLTKVAENVVDTEVNDGRVAWLTSAGKVMTQEADHGRPVPVHVPLDQGCRLTTPITYQSGTPLLAVGRSAIVVTEACGGAKGGYGEVLAFDPSGRRLVHIPGVLTYADRVVGDTLLVLGGDGAGRIGVLRYDFVTGKLARLGWGRTSGPRALPSGSGDYVLWYDAKGGHVAQIPQ